MITSKKLLKQKKISHGFFDRNGGKSNGIYKSLNCGPGSNDKKSKINENLNNIVLLDFDDTFENEFVIFFFCEHQFPKVIIPVSKDGVFNGVEKAVKEQFYFWDGCF